MSESNAVYLHYLDRELTTAAGGGPAPEDIVLVTRALALMTDARLYCGLSSIWENEKVGRYLEEFEILFEFDELTTISGDPTQGLFLNSHQELYLHDISRYPNYFTGSTERLRWAKPTYHKAGGSTGPLAARLFAWADHLPSDSARFSVPVFQAREPVLRALIERGDRAITFSLFNEFVAPMTRSARIEDRIRLEISREFSKNNLAEVNASVASGIFNLAIFDDLAATFPAYDVILLRTVASLCGLADVLNRIETPLDLWKDWVGARQTIQARLNAATVRWLLEAVHHVDSRSEPPKNSDRDHYFSLQQTRLRIRDTLWGVGRTLGNPAAGMHGRPLDDLKTSTLKIRPLASALGDKFPELGQRLDSTRNEIMMDHADLVVMTANQIETDALHHALSKEGFEATASFGRAGTAWIYPPIGGCVVAAVRSSMGSGGPAGSALTASDAVTELRAKSLISLGIAFAMTDSQPIGELLIAEQVAGYEPAKVADSGGSLVRFQRGGSDHCSPALLSRFRDARLDRLGIQVRTGQVLSGEKLVDSLAFRN